MTLQGECGSITEIPPSPLSYWIELYPIGSNEGECAPAQSEVSPSPASHWVELQPIDIMDNEVGNYQQAVQLTSENHPDKSRHLTNFGADNGHRFDHLSDVGDVVNAISSSLQAVRLAPSDHPSPSRHDAADPLRVINSSSTSFLTTYNTSILNSPSDNVTVNNINAMPYPINKNYHYSAAPPITPVEQLPSSLPSCINAPVDRISPCFTGRERELALIANVFTSFHSDTPTRCVIHGMPGLGKSQLVLSHASIAFASDEYSHVFWMSATTVEKVAQGLTKILALVDHRDRSHPDQAVQLAAVRQWLEHSQNHGCRRWLLILDNATVDTVQFIRENMPQQNAGGSILITTRTRRVAEAAANVAGQEHPIFELNALSTVDSVILLLRKAGIESTVQSDLEIAGELVRWIGCLPLAIEQTGSFIKRSGLKNAKQLERLYDEQGLKKVGR